MGRDSRGWATLCCFLPWSTMNFQTRRRFHFKCIKLCTGVQMKRTILFIKGTNSEETQKKLTNKQKIMCLLKAPLTSVRVPYLVYHKSRHFYLYEMFANSQTFLFAWNVCKFAPTENWIFCDLFLDMIYTKFLLLHHSQVAFIFFKSEFDLSDTS